MDGKQMDIVPYLNFDGNCREAFQFYHQVFGGAEPQMLTHADAPIEGLPEEMKDQVLHTRLDFRGQTLMGGDAPPGMHQPGTNISVSIQIDDASEAKRLFDALSESGTVTMEWGEQFWGAHFGMCVDRFGIPWMVNCETSS